MSGQAIERLKNRAEKRKDLIEQRQRERRARRYARRKLLRERRRCEHEFEVVERLPQKGKGQQQVIVMCPECEMERKTIERADGDYSHVG